MASADPSNTVLIVESVDGSFSDLHHNERFRLAESPTGSGNQSSQVDGSERTSVREETPAVHKRDTCLYVTLEDDHRPFDPVEGWVFGFNPEPCDVLLSTHRKSGVSNRHFSINLNPTSHAVVLTCLSRHSTILTSETIGHWITIPPTHRRHLCDQTFVRAGNVQLNILFPKRDERQDRRFHERAASFVYEALEAVPQLLTLQLTNLPETATVEDDTTPRKRAKIEEASRHPGYTYDRVIGRGEFGVVRKAFDRVTGDAVAAKFVDSSKVKTKDAEEEVKTLRRASHVGQFLISRVRSQLIFPIFQDYIVRFIDSLRDDDGTFIIIMELVTGGDLSGLGRLHPRGLLAMTRQMLDALGYLHSLSITHRDVKPTNILMEYKWKFKLTDFGLSKQYDKVDLKTFCGTLQYLAPEVNKRETIYTPAVDIWSLGVVIMEAHSGLPEALEPFDRHSWLTALFRRATELCRRRGSFGKILWTMLLPIPADRTSPAALLARMPEELGDTPAYWHPNSLLTPGQDRAPDGCPLPWCAHGLLFGEVIDDHVLTFHGYSRRISLDHPYIYVDLRDESVNASNLIRICDLPRRCLRARLKRLGISSTYLKGGHPHVQGAYIAYEDARTLCADLDLNPYALEILFRHEDSENAKQVMTASDPRPRALHAQLLVKQQEEEGQEAPGSSSRRSSPSRQPPAAKTIENPLQWSSSHEVSDSESSYPNPGSNETALPGSFGPFPGWYDRVEQFRPEHRPTNASGRRN